MATYRTRARMSSTPVEAMHWSGREADLPALCAFARATTVQQVRRGVLLIDGGAWLGPGDWLIRPHDDAAGTGWITCADVVFQRMYEPAS